MSVLYNKEIVDANYGEKDSPSSVKKETCTNLSKAINGESEI